MPKSKASVIDLYKELGVRRNASAAAIKKAHRALVLKCHPDVKGGDIDRFRRVDTAYKVLRDPEKRSAYDETGAYSLESVQTEMQKVMTVMVQIYDHLLETGKAFDKRVSIIDLMGKIVAENIAKTDTNIAEIEGQIDRLIDLRGTISREDDGDNLFVRTTDGHVERKRAALDQIRGQAHTLGLVKEELGNYSSFARAAQAVHIVWATSMNATSATASW